MSELQTEADTGETIDNQDQVDNGDIDNQGAETVESGADLATAAGETQDKTQDGVQKAINKQHAKFKEEERKRIASDNEVQGLREKLDAIEAERGKIVIPPLPESYDEDFTEKLEARETAIRQQAARDARQTFVTEQQATTKETAAKVERERVGELVKGYGKRTAALGLNADEIKNAGDTVVSYGISGDLAQFILGDDDGPLITKYLADNPIQLDDLSNMPTGQAFIKINSDIRTAASVGRPQASQAPDPPEQLNGQGKTESKDPRLAGVIYL